MTSEDATVEEHRRLHDLPLLTTARSRTDVSFHRLRPE